MSPLEGHSPLICVLVVRPAKCEHVSVLSVGEEQMVILHLRHCSWKQLSRPVCREDSGHVLRLFVSGLPRWLCGVAGPASTPFCPCGLKMSANKTR